MYLWSDGNGAWYLTTKHIGSNTVVVVVAVETCFRTDQPETRGHMAHTNTNIAIVSESRG